MTYQKQRNKFHQNITLLSSRIDAVNYHTHIIFVACKLVMLWLCAMHMSYCCVHTHDVCDVVGFREMRGPHGEECVILAWGQHHIPQCYLPWEMNTEPKLQLVPAYLYSLVQSLQNSRCAVRDEKTRSFKDPLSFPSRP